MIAVPSVSVVVCTRNRGDRIRDTIQTIFDNTATQFEFIIVDQSADDRTATVVQQYAADPRLRYLRSQTHGISRARNEGLLAARGELVLMTDDDCTVPPDWIATIVAIFQQHPQVALVYSDVVAGPHDPSQGFILTRHIPREALVHTMAAWLAIEGALHTVGAAMAMRRAQALAIGGFDPLLGGGVALKSGEDLDFGLRMLLHTWGIYHTKATSVTHFGFRPWAEARNLKRGYAFGVGAVHGKLARCGQWRVLGSFLQIAVVTTIRNSVPRLLKLQRPRGVGETIALFKGFIHSWSTPIDRQRWLFQDAEYPHPRPLPTVDAEQRTQI